MLLKKPYLASKLHLNSRTHKEYAQIRCGMCYEIRTIIWCKDFETPRISSHLRNQVTKYGDNAESLYHISTQKQNDMDRLGGQMLGLHCVFTEELRASST